MRSSLVAPAERSPSAKRKARTLKTAEGLPVQSFSTLLKNLATLTKNRVQPKIASVPRFDTLTRPTALQQRALSLLAVPL